MDLEKIKELALANGFKLKEQADGSMDLNAYVYDFANAIEQAAKADTDDQITVSYERLQELIEIGVKAALEAKEPSKAQAVPEGFVVVNQKDLLELTIAINAVDLATHTESKTNEVREMWQQVALKLMALCTAQEPTDD